MSPWHGNELDYGKVRSRTAGVEINVCPGVGYKAVVIGVSALSGRGGDRGVAGLCALSARAGDRARGCLAGRCMLLGRGRSGDSPPSPASANQRSGPPSVHMARPERLGGQQLSGILPSPFPPDDAAPFGSPSLVTP